MVSQCLVKARGVTVFLFLMIFLFLFSFFFCKQIFTNADKVHAVKVLNKLGLEDCFEGIICFETLNPIHKSTVSDDEDDIEFVGLSTTATSTNANTISSSKIFDIIGHLLSQSPVWHYRRHALSANHQQTPQNGLSKQPI